MKRDKPILGVIALSGALGLGLAPAQAQSIPEGLQPKDDATEQRQPAERSQQSEMGHASDTAGQPAAQEVKKVQEALKDKGHDPGPIDGVLGPQTQKALKDFQVASGIRASGAIDPQTAQKLGVENGSSSGEGSMN